MSSSVVQRSLTRRQFAASLLRASGALLAAPPLIRALDTPGPAILSGSSPRITHGLASGDVSGDSAIVWSRCDRPARMIVEWSTTESFKKRGRVKGPVATESNDFTAKVTLRDLPPGQRIFYRIQFEDQADQLSQVEVGQLVTAARDESDVFFAWSGDTCGQGYGIDRSRGGMLTYRALRELQPDFFIHSGDTIYADGPLNSEIKLPDGSVWKNLVTEAKAKVAETLEEFRGNYRYNLEDDNVRQFNAAVSTIVQWDDHEVRNNWFPTQILEDERYTIRDVDVLARNARQAFRDYWPIRSSIRNRIFRRISRGPLCEVFVFDLRSYRGPNTLNRQEVRSEVTDYLGPRQLRWMKRALLASRATWKIIASDMPIGLVVADGKAFENCANGAGPALGRELEIADLLSFIKSNAINNVVWLTADVHYAASHRYEPDQAQSKDFNPFWEFVSGPLHAASLGPGGMDNTFGPIRHWTSRPRGAKSSGPYSSEQFFSTVRIDGESRLLTVTHHNRDGKALAKVELPAT